MADMKFRMSSEFGALEEVRQGKAHTGIDLVMPEGTELRSLAEGIVKEVYDGTGNIGKGVKIELEDGSQIIYGHMSEVSVKTGEILKQGESIGLSGNTGNVVGENGGYHLHFAMKNSEGEFIDPTELADEVADMSGKLDMDSPAWWDIKGRVNEAVEEAIDNAKEESKEAIYDFLGALRDVVLEVIDSVVLVGGGALIILKCYGLEKGHKWFYIAFASRILIKACLGGYMA